MRTGIGGLFAAGEAVGGAAGANRLSGNAIPEAFVFGERAGRFAAADATGGPRGWDGAAARAVIEEGRALCGANGGSSTGATTGATGLMTELQDLMWRDVGLLRTVDGLQRALGRIQTMAAHDLPAMALPAERPFNLALMDWFELRAALLCAEAVTVAALGRSESRGAHQREDLPETLPELEQNQTVALQGGALVTGWTGVVRRNYELAETRAAP